MLNFHRVIPTFAACGVAVSCSRSRSPKHSAFAVCVWNVREQAWTQPQISSASRQTIKIKPHKISLNEIILRNTKQKNTCANVTDLRNHRRVWDFA